ncbi:uncharacterized protein KRP23_9488 [Phytophthora ramorum]|uniref:uncharacterized protein n=1 Tax=Phytophthora ramorum TaxID=164328 RepID=UPI0030A174C8|nr:hypothetical protein KRP23_9488 [Phytophthora ramorum]
MRLHYLLFATVIGLLANANSLSASSDTKMVSPDSSSDIDPSSAAHSHESGKGFLRAHKTAKADNDDSSSGEERGWKEAADKVTAAARLAKAKAQFPFWYLMGKKPLKLKEELKLAGVYPLIGKKNWPILKSYMKYYDARHINYP